MESVVTPIERVQPYHSSGDNRSLSDQYAEAGEDWVDKVAAADLLEDLKSAFKAERIAMQGDMAHNRAENLVLASADWRDYITKMINARKAANRAKIAMTVIEMRAWEENNRGANERMAARF